MPLELVLAPGVELLKLPDPVVFGGAPVWLVPAVGSRANRLVLLLCATPPGKPHGRPCASVRPVLFDVPAVDGLVPVVPDADGLVVGPDADGLDGDVVDVPAEPLIPVEPLIPAAPLPVPDDAPALPAALPDVPPDAPPEPPPCASANPVLPASRIAAINDTEGRVFCIANSR